MTIRVEGGRDDNEVLANLLLAHFEQTPEHWAGLYVPIVAARRRCATSALTFSNGTTPRLPPTVPSSQARVPVIQG